MIGHKLWPATPDSTCKDCTQLYNSECRAYRPPQSKEEREHRWNGAARCEKHISPELRR